MKYAAFALAALAAAGMASAQTKWVPLNSVDRKPGPTAPPPSVAAPPAVQPSAVTPPTASVPATHQPLPHPTTGSTDKPLQVTCLGAGTANKFAIVSGSSSGSFSGFAGTTMISGSVSGSSSTVIPRDRDFADQVDIQLFNGDDRIRLPRTMLPPLHGGRAGWFKLKHVVADARSIRASAAVNFLNNPKVYIDRITGTISISGKAGDYSGECQAVQADASKKF